MSVAARRAVWAQQYESSTLKLLALALAEYADSSGFCWPSVQTLANHIGMDVDYTHKKIKRLIALGDILHKRGGGRGNCSIYCIVIDRSDDERAALALELSRSRICGNVRVIDENTVLESSVLGSTSDEGEQSAVDVEQSENTVLQYSVSGTENTVLQNTVLQNTVLQSGKHCTGVRSGEGRSSASESVKTTQKPTEIDHGFHDDDDVVTRSNKKSRRRGRAPAHVEYLSAAGMGAAHLFADLDPVAAVADFDARRDDNWDIAAIVAAWKIAPPAVGRVYERHAKNPVERSATAPANRSSSTQQRGEDYYTKRSR